MSDEDILKTVADELRRFGDFDNIDYLIPQLGQAIENILAKYDRALSDLVKAEKEKNDLKNKIIEKLKKEKLPNVIVGGRRNAKTLEYGKKLGRIEMCEELLGEER